MDIFRPFIDQNLSLSTFSASDATPEAVFLASLNQLKHLALVFYSNFPEAKYPTQWQHVGPHHPTFRCLRSRSNLTMAG